MAESARAFDVHSSEQDDPGVLVGWSHRVFSLGIDLQLQKRGLGSTPDEVGSERYLLTRNQALILAQYLLDATGQDLPRDRRRDAIGRLFRPRRGQTSLRA